MTWKIYVLMSGAGAVAAYALSLASTAPTARVVPPQAAVSVPEAGVDMQALADSLGESVDAATSFRAPTRDAFSFAGTPAASSVSAAAGVTDVEPQPLVPGPAAPPFGLFGVMGDSISRTAVLSSLGGVSFAHEGDTVGGAWQVVEIGGASVTLESLADGARTTLHLFGAPSP